MAPALFSSISSFRNRLNEKTRSRRRCSRLYALAACWWQQKGSLRLTRFAPRQPAAAHLPACLPASLPTFLGTAPAIRFRAFSVFCSLQVHPVLNGTIDSPRAIFFCCVSLRPLLRILSALTKRHPPAPPSPHPPTHARDTLLCCYVAMGASSTWH